MFRFISLIFLSFFATISHASLITNGSFEDNEVSSGKWTWMTSDNVNGWSGSNIEIWNNLNNVTAFDGNNFIELNSHAEDSVSFSIYQDIETILGEEYSLSFAYRARGKGDESFSVDVLSIFSDNNYDVSSEWKIDDHNTNNWNIFDSSFIAKSELTRVQFTSILPQNTMGNLIDGIEVNPLFDSSNLQETSSVAEPSGLLLLVFSLPLLISRKRKFS